MPETPLVQSSTHHSSLPALEFEAYSVEGGLQQMNRAEVGVDDQLSIGPLGVPVSVDDEFEGELFDEVIVSGLEFVIG